MRVRSLVLAGALGFAQPFVFVSAAHAQLKPATTGWTAPRTPWGAPSLEGIWTSDDARTVPLERPAEFAGRELLTDQEFAERTKRADDTRQDTRTAAGVFVGEWGTRSLRQTSLVVDPPDGRLPARTLEAQRRAAEIAALQSRRPNYWEDRSLTDRCLVRGGVVAIMPGLYGNGIRIVQNPGYVAITYEMIHETRLIPLDGRPHVGPRLRQFLGDSRGRWEGQTLVVETTNFTDRTAVVGAPTSEGLHVVERISRVAPDTIAYEVGYNDPRTWSRPWKLMVPLTTQPGYQIYSYECHEGNYALRNILSAARAEERAIQLAVEKGLDPPPPSSWQGADVILRDDPTFGFQRRR